MKGDGDCAACVFGGILDLGTVNTVYERCKDVANRFDLRSALYEMKSEGLVDSFVLDMPIWVPSNWSFGAPWGMPSWSMGMQWFAYLRLGIESGHYAMATVSFDAKGPVQIEKSHHYYGHTDHAVLLCGVRERRIPHESMPGAAEIRQEVQVSCSSKSSPDLEWVSVRDFLAKRGGYNIVLIRPAVAS